MSGVMEEMVREQPKENYPEMVILEGNSQSEGEIILVRDQNIYLAPIVYQDIVLSAKAIRKLKKKESLLSRSSQSKGNMEKQTTMYKLEKLETIRTATPDLFLFMSLEIHF